MSTIGRLTKHVERAQVFASTQKLASFCGKFTAAVVDTERGYFACANLAHQSFLIVRGQRYQTLTTPKQVAANRLNAQRSTGPKSPEGKAVSRFNAVTHGLTATRTLLPGEDAGEYEELLDSLRRMFPSSDKMQDMLVVRAADLMWRLRRVVYFESGLIAWAQRSDLRKDETASRIKLLRTPARLPIRDTTRAQSDIDLDDFHRAGRTFDKLFNEGDVLNKLSRYEQGLARQLDQTISRLERLKR